MSSVSFRGNAARSIVAQAEASAGVRHPAIKRATDIVVALAALLVVLPLMAILAALLLPGGRPIFRQQRVGQNGTPFWCYKFRTMRVDAEQVLAAHLRADPELAREWQATQKLRNDPRVTRFGRWLRVSSLDELPQLVNVLKGDMSLVGPRPVTMDELARYGTHSRHYLGLRPGITGLWQVSGRSTVGYEQRVALDVHYALHHSTWLDLRILVKTAAVVFFRVGAY